MSELPLSLSQQQIFFDQIAWPGSCHLNVGGTGNINGNLNLDTYRKALDKLVRQHAILRTTIDVDGRQSILAGWDEALLEYVDLSVNHDAVGQCELLCQQAFAETFVFAKGRRPWQMLMMKIADNHHIVMARFHHLIMDGYSVALAFRELGLMYQQLYTGVALEADAISKVSFDEFIDVSQSYQESKAWQKDAQWWRSELAQIRPSSLTQYSETFPENVVRDGGSSLANAYHYFYFVKRQQYSQYEKFTREEGLTPYHLYGAALVSYLAGVLQSNEIVIGVPILNRGGKRFKNTLGMFAVLLPLKISVSPTMSFIDLMRHFAQKLKEVYRHAKFPLTEIMNQQVSVQTRPDSPSENPLMAPPKSGPGAETDKRLFDVILSYELHDFSVSFGDANLQRIQRCFSPLARYPLTICICEFHQDEPIEIAIESSLAHFSEGETQLLGTRLQHIIKQVLLSPTKPLSGIQLVTAIEQEELTRFRHANISQCPESGTVLEHIYHQSRLVPHNIAIKTTSSDFSYEVLWQQVEQVARQLMAHDITKGEVVAVICGRSVDVLILYLSVSRLGAIYVPMDPTLPSSRLNGMLADCKPKLVVHQLSHDQLVVPQNATMISIVEWKMATACYVGEKTDLPAWPENNDAMYILFTSGSTGTPKGVVVPHGALVTRIAWLAKTFAITPADITLQSIPLSFDPAQLEIYLPLTQGACCALVPPGNVAPDDLLTLVKQLEATTIIFVPTTLRHFMSCLAQKHQTTDKLTLRIAISGGEQLPGALAEQFVRSTGARLFNLYGPTEACIFASAYEYQLSDNSKSVPIGRPVDNTQLFVLDEYGRLLPDGAVGELYIGGSGLAKGYLNESDTEKRFLPDFTPHCPRLYKTGDLVSWNRKKQLQFVGRADNQLKLHGIRIEPAEIENALEQFAPVVMAAVKTCQGRLVAWMTLHQEKTPAGSSGDKKSGHGDDYDGSQTMQLYNELREHLRCKLPLHQMPEEFIVVDTIPLMPSGKTDYSRLQPSSGYSLIPDNEATGPQDKLQRWLHETWTALLQKPPQSIDTSFNQAGGDSLLALNLLARIQKHKGVEIPLATFLRHDTIRKLAHQIKKQKSVICQNVSGHQAGIRIYLAASGHGDAMRFQRLAKALQNKAHILMLQPPMDDELAELKETGDLAGLYYDKIKAENYQGRCIVAGFSVAGVAAIETALLCQQQKIKVDKLILIDTTFPGWLVRNTPIWQLTGKLVALFKLQQLDVNHRTLGTLFSDSGLMFQVQALRKFVEPRCQIDTRLIVSSAFSRWHRWLFRPWYRVFGTTLEEQQMDGYHGTLFDDSQVTTLASLLIRDFED